LRVNSEELEVISPSSSPVVDDKFTSFAAFKSTPVP
jgi:hypothetical protein